MKLTPPMIESILHRVELGQTTVEDANQLRAYILSLKADVLEDGFGNAWSPTCPECGGRMEIVRPGKVQCENEGAHE